MPLCRDAALHIYKERGELELFCEGRLSLRFPVTFGRDPRPRKTRIGDQRTPEGSYRVCSMVRVPRAHLFIGISYPNENEAGAALASGLLSLGQYRAIRQAHLGGRCPPRNTPLGHGIGIHGVPAGYELAASVWTWVSRIGALHRYIGFTDGCILMTNGDLERLWARVQRGTPVVIHGSRRQLWPREATAESSSFWPTSSSR